MAEARKQTDEKQYQPNGKHKLTKAGPGRPKGSKNRYTKLKDRILDAVEDAAKVAGYKTAEEYLAAMCSGDGMNFLRIAASLLPRESNVNLGGQEDNPVQFAPVEIVMRDSKDKDTEG